MLTITYFVHGTTTDNEKDLATGQNQGELSELGKTQSKKLGEMIKDQKFDAIFCSDLKRAIDSTRLFFGDHAAFTTDKRLREADYGDYTGKDSRLFKNNLENFIDTPFPNGESYQDVKRRMVNFLQEIYPKYHNSSIAIIAHQAPQFALERIAHQKPWTEIIANDWRKTKSWQPGWKYIINEENLMPCRVGAYGIIINDNKIALVKTSHGNYFLPGGKIEENETPEECIKREFIEEVGLDIEVKKKNW